MDITIEVLEALIADAQHERRLVTERMAELHRELDSLEQRRDDLMVEEASYQRTMDRKFPSARPDPTVQQPTLIEAPSAEDLSALPRTAAVEAAIREITKAGNFASPGEIQEWLKSHHRSDSRDHIGAALAYLNRKGKVRSLGRAQWAHTS